jgi:hypothetical protein
MASKTVQSLKQQTDAIEGEEQGLSERKSAEKFKRSRTQINGINTKGPFYGLGI